MNITLPAEKDQIEQILPHRDPFLWVTRVVECVPGERVVAELDVNPDLPLFQGHFPDYPVLPGVIIMEALAQAASIAVLVQRDAGNTIGFLTGIDNAKFRRQVRPGETIRLEGTIVKANKRMCVAEVAAYVGDEVCATATQKYVMAESDAV